jgi:putative PIN family toxin of toxin-antitoxin system
MGGIAFKKERLFPPEGSRCGPLSAGKPQSLIRVVADTNIYISGTFWPGVNRMVLNLARHDVLSLYSSPQLLHEFSRTLKGKKFRLSEAQVDILLKDLLSYTLPGVEGSVAVPRLRDPKDLFLCSLVVGSTADYLVTGDQDLLVLKQVKKIPIVSPRRFLEIEFPELLDAYEQGQP